MAGEGRFFLCRSGTGNRGRSLLRIPARIDWVSESVLCTTLSRDTDGVRVRTVEHLLSALEATGVDNCGIQMVAGDEVGARTLFFQYLLSYALVFIRTRRKSWLYLFAPYLHYRMKDFIIYISLGA